MGTSAKRHAPTGIPTRSNCSGHEDCQTGKCNHTRKQWDLRAPTPGAKYEKKRRASRIGRRRATNPKPGKMTGPSRSARRRGRKSRG